jgi:amino acid transporter
MDYFSAHKGYDSAVAALNEGAGNTIATLDIGLRNAYNAWLHAPAFGNFKLILNIPAFLIVTLISYIVYIGIKESKKANNTMVMIKLAVIILVIIAGAFYVDTDNWSNFIPNGFSGVMSGVSAVFFAYIGFDAISTTAEECKNPQKDLPRAMFNTLIICTTLYCILVLVLTGMTNYSQLNVADPLAFVFQNQNSKLTNWIAAAISISAIFVIASVLLVYQLGQPRIWMSMSRDGLLPKIFSRIHPKYRTPSFSTVLTGVVVAVPALFLNLDVVIALTSIGTLFAFVLVCGGVLALHQQPDKPESKFKVPYMNAKLIVPFLFILSVTLILIYVPAHFQNIFQKESLPMLAFWIVAFIVSVFSFIKNYSLIPVLGLLSCFYLMAQESHTNWYRFFIWLVIGLVIYFTYGYKNSRLAANALPGAGE